MQSTLNALFGILRDPNTPEAALRAFAARVARNQVSRVRRAFPGDEWQHAVEAAESDDEARMGPARRAIAGKVRSVEPTPSEAPIIRAAKGIRACVDPNSQAAATAVAFLVIDSVSEEDRYDEIRWQLDQLERLTA